MRSRWIRRCLCFVLIGMFALAGRAPVAGAQITYDLANDWADFRNVSPNGYWHYGYLDATGTFNHFRFYNIDTLTGSWANPQFRLNGGFPLTLFKLQSSASGSNDGPIGRIGGHTQNDTAVSLAVEWIAKEAGWADIFGGAWMWRNLGRPEMMSLFLNGTPLFDDVLIPVKGVATSSNPFSFAAASLADGHDPMGLSHRLLAKGDVLTFAIHKSPQAPFGDLVGMDFSVRFNPVPEPGTFGAMACGCLVGLSLLVKRSRLRPH